METRRGVIGLLGLAVVIVMSASDAAAQSVPADTVIRLERTSCFGECPVYTVTIDATGRVTYEGMKFVRVIGRQTNRIPVSRVAALLATAERIGFFELKEYYSSITNADGTETIVTDLPTTIVRVTRNGQTRRVVDYVGAPDALTRFEKEIDTAAGTERWIRLDERTLRELVQDGWSPSFKEKAELLRNALLHDDVAVVKGLIELGANPNGEYHDTGTTPLMMVRSAAAARVLLDAGANPSAQNEHGLTPLGAAAYLPSTIANMLIEAGARPDQPSDADGRTPLWHAACAGNIGVVTALLDAGADARRPSGGMSALECARQAQEDGRKARPPALEVKPPFAQDFDQVIAALQQALAKRSQR